MEINNTATNYAQVNISLFADEIEELKRTEASILDIYNNLVAGLKLNMDFGSLEEAKSIRNLIAVTKVRHNKLALAIGMYTEDEIPVFNFQILTKEPPIRVVLSFTPKRIKRVFSFKIIDDDTSCVSSNENCNPGQKDN